MTVSANEDQHVVCWEADAENGDSVGVYESECEDDTDDSRNTSEDEIIFCDIRY
jgi:hypothetical protein